MSKEKAIENIKEALKYTAKTSLIGTSPAEVATAVSWAEILLLRALKELEDQNMTKFKVVRYWDTYPDGVVATCDTQEEAEKICKEYLKKRKPMYDYLVRKENE